ncbi:MAG: hypothetical protein ACO3UY_09380, partial [Opitutales bacterium]
LEDGQPRQSVKVMAKAIRSRTFTNGCDIWGELPGGRQAKHEGIRAVQMCGWRTREDLNL